MSKIITAVFSGSQFTTTGGIFQWDAGDVLQFSGVELPASYKVHFANSPGGVATERTGGPDGVVIPEELTATGAPVYAWIVLEDASNIYADKQITIPVWHKARPQGTLPPGPQGDDARTIIENTVNTWMDAHAGEIGVGVTEAVKVALLDIFEHVAYIDDQGQTYYDALEEALYYVKSLESISAQFNQSSAVIYDADTLASLRRYLAVIAEYSDGSSELVTNYTLSGTLTEGTSTITATYEGETDTFEVAVTHLEMELQSIEADFNQGDTVIYTDDNYEEVIPPLLHVYGIYTAVIDGSTVTRTVEVTDYTLSGVLVEGRSLWTATYEGKSDTFYVTATKYVPDGYITDGLVFFLDGKHGASANQWKDLIGGKTFALTNCSLGSNGVVFNGSTSYGEYNGAVTSDWENETIEVVVTVANPAQSQNRGVLYQPLIDGHIGISMHFGYHGNGQPRFALCTDGVNRDTAWAALTQAANKVGGNADRVILNGTAVTNTDNTNYAANTTGIAVIGCRKTTSSPDGQHFFEGTIHAIRIYSRKLSQAEILANQSVDAEYYGV